MMKFKTKNIDGLDIFYREGGSSEKPNFLLLHGFPTSSSMFRHLAPMLESNFHVIAPDYIGFGNSAAPNHTEFDYTFENLTKYVIKLIDELELDKFYMYVFDYGAPIGFNIAVKYPERILGIISQNGNVYKEGLGKKWAGRENYWQHPTPELRKKYMNAFTPETIKGQYLRGGTTKHSRS
ncbi:alpha/beta fold hydrolase [Lactobacillus sp. PV012]|uniref:alpha/beta fold hydrolase n=1 Tax=Lactobacillus sp. PV012 TaxID=2594494 RepID=UPI00223F26D9|nr:alpha/beta fold hydrolase [Lactobacillus sp. PV012]